MDFILNNIFEILLGLAVAFYIVRAFVTHKPIDQRMEETINDPNYDPMANDPAERAYRKRKAASESEGD